METNNVRIVLMVNPKIAEHLEKQDNRSQYLRNLILNDMIKLTHRKEKKLNV